MHFGPNAPTKAVRVVAAITDPATLPDVTTWYLATNLPHPDAPAASEVPFAPADPAEMVRLNGLRNWVEQSYKQVKQELGWADFMVRSDSAIRRDCSLVWCAFSFCWSAWFAQGREPAAAPEPAAPPDEDGEALPSSTTSVDVAAMERGEIWPVAAPTVARVVPWPVTLRRMRAWLDPWTLLWRCRHWWLTRGSSRQQHSPVWGSTTTET